MTLGRRLMAASTPTGRRFYVVTAKWIIPSILIRGDSEEFTHEPYWAEAGWHRAVLDLETHTAILSEADGE